MKIPRRIATRATRAACALLLTAGIAGVFAFAYLDRTPQPNDDAVARQTSTESRAAQPQPPRPVDKDAGVEPPTGAALRLDDAMDLDPAVPSPPTAPAADTDIAANGVDASAAGDFVESHEPKPSLNLKVPDDASVADLVEQLANADKNEREADTKPATSNITLNAEGEVEVNPEVESFSIFNPEYGLRGFMKQNWINQRVAFQGGFGLDDDRTSETGDDDFRDNIAVGMGLILAF